MEYYLMIIYQITIVIVRFGPNELQKEILVQKSLDNTNSYNLFLIKNITILDDLKDCIINSYVSITCPLLNLI